MFCFPLLNSVEKEFIGITEVLYNIFFVILDFWGSTEKSYHDVKVVGRGFVHVFLQ